MTNDEATFVAADDADNDSDGWSIAQHLVRRRRRHRADA
jgi:hypothetical protein